MDNDIGNFALGGTIARRLEDVKLDKGFHGSGKRELEEAWAIMKERVEAALLAPTLAPKAKGE
jgi:hypothetical protein